MLPHPLIGIPPAILEPKPGRPFFGTYRTYVAALEAGGAIPVILSPNLQRIPPYVRTLDGLLLTGGGDIHPKHYGRKPHPKAGLDLSPEERTAFELAITRAFLKARKPILGICLGCQTLAVATGGELIQDLPDDAHRKAIHTVDLAKDSKLRKALKTERLHVNSRHHQAVWRVGKGTRVVAISPDQVIEGVEISRHPFAVGVQWHPEEMIDRKNARDLFRSFLRHCASPLRS